MNGLDLFSGIGGITKALEGYVTPIAYCENDRYGMGVLLSRMASGDLPIAPIWDDIRTLKGYHMPHPIGLIYGGFPCQDISVAGRGAGLEGKRSGLFFEIARLIGEIRPRFVFLENVPAINRRGGDTVVGTLADLGYDARWDVLSARDVGANHRRERWWLLAHSRHGIGRDIGALEAGKDPQKKRSGDHNATGRSGEQFEDVANASSLTKRKQADQNISQPAGRKAWNESGLGCVAVADPARRENVKRKSGYLGQETWGGKSVYTSSGISSEDVSDPHSKRRAESDGAKHKTVERRGWWESEPRVGRVAHGIPFRVDRLRGLGNAVVPSQAREAFERLMGLK